MQRFFELTFRPFFLITGILTALGAVVAFRPGWVAEKVELIPFNHDHTIILQHWGAMLGLTGALMVVAAFYEAWRNPILLFSALEKGIFVGLVLANLNRPYGRSVWAGTAMDAVVALYIVAYFIACGFREPYPTSRC